MNDGSILLASAITLSIYSGKDGSELLYHKLQSIILSVTQWDSQTILVSCDDSTVRVLKLTTTTTTTTTTMMVVGESLMNRRMCRVESEVNCILKLKGNTRVVLFGLWNGNIEVRKFENFRRLLVLEGPTGATACLSELHDKTIVSGHTQGQLKRWRFSCEGADEYLNNNSSSSTASSNAFTVSDYEGHKKTVNEVIQLRDKTAMASCSADGSIIIWDIELRCPNRVLRGHNSDVTSIVELSDGSLISGSFDGTLKVWVEGRSLDSLIVSPVSYLFRSHDESIGIVPCNLNLDDSVVIQVRKTWIQLSQSFAFIKRISPDDD